MNENIDNQSKLSFVSKTDVGMVRSNNEDFYDFFSSDFGEVFIICDGMGGYSGGEIASKLATNTIKNRIQNNPHRLTYPPDIIREAIDVANKVIIDKSNEDASLKGMGTTVVILIIKNNFAYYGHVGDSRLYLSRGNIFTGLTKDHSFVQQLVDKGLITPKEAETHPRKNEITKALGISENLNPEIRQDGLKIYKGDKFLLCSDGLNSMVSDEEISKILSDYDIEDAADILIEKANEYGGKDNITLQIVRVDEGEELTEEVEIGNLEFQPKAEKVDIEFDDEDSDEVINEIPELPKKKSSFFKFFYFLLPLILVLIIFVLIYIMFIHDKRDSKRKTTTDTTVLNTTKSADKITTGINKDSLVLEILKDLYAGKKNNQLYNANNIEYIGMKSKESMTEDDFIKNLKDYYIEFKNIEGNINSNGDTVSCEYKISLGKDKSAIYEIFINFSQKPYKIDRIKFKKELKTESGVKPPVEKKKEIKKEQDKNKKEQIKKPKEEIKQDEKKESKVKEYRKDLNKEEQNQENNKQKQ